MLTFQSETLHRMYRHATSTFPEECCGAILSTDGEEFVRPCRNIQNERHQEEPDVYPRDARTAYLMHPDDLIALHKEAETQHRPIKAFYHSHPNHDAYFSEKDKADAVAWGQPIYPDVAYVVISVYDDDDSDGDGDGDGDGTDIRAVKAYVWDVPTSDFVEVEIETLR